MVVGGRGRRCGGFRTVVFRFAITYEKPNKGKAKRGTHTMTASTRFNLGYTSSYTNSPSSFSTNTSCTSSYTHSCTSGYTASKPHAYPSALAVVSWPARLKMYKLPLISSSLSRIAEVEPSSLARSDVMIILETRLSFLSTPDAISLRSRASISSMYAENSFVARKIFCTLAGSHAVGRLLSHGIWFTMIIGIRSITTTSASR